LWPNGWVDQDATWQRGRPRPMPHCVRWGPSPPQQSLPTFGPCLLWPNGRPSRQLLSCCYCGQRAGYIKMPLGMEVGLSPGDFVLDGDSAPSPKRGGAPPVFGPSIVAKRLHGSRCHGMRHCVRWEPSSPPLKGHWPLVGLGLCDIVLDGNPAPLPKRDIGPTLHPPILGQCPLWLNGWTD